MKNTGLYISPSGTVTQPGNCQAVQDVAAVAEQSGLTKGPAFKVEQQVGRDRVQAGRQSRSA